MRDLINIVSEDTAWGATPEREETPESAALAALRDAHQKYVEVLQHSTLPSAPAKMKLLSKIAEILNWLG